MTAQINGMTFIHGRPDGVAIEATQRGKRNYPPDGGVELGGVKLTADEPDMLFCTCTEGCAFPCAGEVDCVGHCEACHFVRLRAEEDGMIEGSTRSKS